MNKKLRIKKNNLKKIKTKNLTESIVNRKEKDNSNNNQSINDRVQIKRKRSKSLNATKKINILMEEENRLEDNVTNGTDDNANEQKANETTKINNLNYDLYCEEWDRKKKL